jgi:hypothetical protein
MPHIPKMTPFYNKVLNTWRNTQTHQINKGAEKYPEPFNPESWTSKELLNHAMEEAVDLTTYLVGLYTHIENLENEIKRLKEK